MSLNQISECTGFHGVSHIHMYRLKKFLAMAEKSKGEILFRRHKVYNHRHKENAVSGEKINSTL
jgi:hypothetical protein